jgi:hypothetical protein
LNYNEQCADGLTIDDDDGDDAYDDDDEIFFSD